MDKVLFSDNVTLIDFICRMVGGGSAMLVMLIGVAWSIRETIKDRRKKKWQ